MKPVSVCLFRGFTLIESLFALAITTLLLSMALPAMSHTVKRMSSLSISNQVTGLVNFSRAASISSNEVVTLCGSSDGRRCNGAWSTQILVFTDNNSDGQMNEKDLLLKQEALLKPGETLVWRSFRNKSYLQLHPNGLTYFQNGNFTYCPADGDEHYALHWILSATGRLRLASDSDGDGIPENAEGKNIEC